MKYSTGAGSAMQVEPIRIQFARGARPGPNPRLDTEDIPAIRQMLRGPSSLEEIAEKLGVNRLTLMRFIKRRQICDLGKRRAFLSLQKSIDRLDAKEGRSWVGK